MASLIALLTGIAVAAIGVSCHPQCLDFLPPFTPSTGLSYCSQYAHFTCCSSSDDARIRSNVWALNASIAAAADPPRCREIMKELSCARCSPYASHIYNAELTGTATTIAGLCQPYCLQAVSACGMSLIQNIAGYGNTTFANTSQLCQKLEPLDNDYCVPAVRNFTQRLAQMPSSSPGPVGRLNCLCVKEVLTGLRNPILAVNAGDGSHRLFVGEQLGVVRVLFPNGTVADEPFVDIQDLVVTSSNEGDERGLLGMAFHPNFTSNGYVFFHLNVYINGYLYNRIIRYNVEANDTNTVDRSTGKTILEVHQPYGNHNGGEIFFGYEDGYLYVFLGDGGSAGDPLNSGLDRSTLLGSVLRLDINTNSSVPYAIPESNPFAGANAMPGVRQEIFAYGMRNPWRCSQDMGDRARNDSGRGRIFCGDVGQSRIEEIDLIESGQNYGWRAYEGTQCYRSDQCAVETSTRFPIWEYPHSVGKSVTGGYMYRGCLSPNLAGLYIYGDFVSGRVFSLEEVSNQFLWNNTELCFGGSTTCNNGLTDLSSARNILSFGQDESGEVYILATNFASTTNNQGKLFWLVDPSRRGDPTKCFDRFGSPVGATEIPAHFTNGGTVDGDLSTGSPSSADRHGETPLAVMMVVLSALLPTVYQVLLD